MITNTHTSMNMNTRKIKSYSHVQTAPNDQNLQSQNLDPQKAHLHNILLRHNKTELERVVPISAQIDKKPNVQSNYQVGNINSTNTIPVSSQLPMPSGYYIMTELLQANSIQCYTKEITAKSGNKFTSNVFRLIGTNNSTNAEQLVNNLNTFIKGVAERLKYMMKIPQYKEKTSFYFTVNTIKINNCIKYRNIVEIDNNKNNLELAELKEILTKCNYKLLIKINYLLITATSVILNARIVRVIPESLDPLFGMTKINVLNEFNKKSKNNVNKYNEIICSADTTCLSKKQVNNELKKLFCVPINNQQ